MPEPDLSDTQPNDPLDDTQPSLPAEVAEKRGFPRWLPFLVLLLLVAGGLLGGYASGMGLRYSAQNTINNGLLDEQYKLCQQAMDTGQFEVARQHCEFVLQQNPNFPGIKTTYADLLLRMQVTPTFTYTPTEQISPTPDLRGADEQFNSAQEFLKAGDWNGTLQALDTLRKIAPEYHTTQVDGMYYTALYQRAFNEIRPMDDCHKTNLNAGINDFTLAEHFGQLDNTADGLRIYSRLYIAGSSFWDQDWKQAQDLFSQVMAAFPNLMDSSCMTATERWRQATVKYANELANQGDMCGAADQYEAALTINSPDNQNFDGAAAEARAECEGNTNGGNEAPSVTPTNETPIQPAETPTFTLEPTLPPTETPTP